MNRISREYMKSLSVIYHRDCSGNYCQGHVYNSDGQEVEVEEYNFIRSKLGIPRNKLEYKLPYRISNPGDLFKLSRKIGTKYYIDIEKLQKKFNLKEILVDSCCGVCYDDEGTICPLSEYSDNSKEEV